MRFLILAMFLALAGCGETVSRQGQVLTMGDSLMAWNRASGSSVSDHVERILGTPVVDRSMSAAVIMRGLPGFNIPAQFDGGSWKWVILNGGGNDLWLGCGCAICSRRLDRIAATSLSDRRRTVCRRYLCIRRDL